MNIIHLYAAAGLAASLARIQMSGEPYWDRFGRELINLAIFTMTCWSAHYLNPVLPDWMVLL